jgi:hypothetical protein
LLWLPAKDAWRGCAGEIPQALISRPVRVTGPSRISGRTTGIITDIDGRKHVQAFTLSISYRQPDLGARRWVLDHSRSVLS